MRGGNRGGTRVLGSARLFGRLLSVIDQPYVTDRRIILGSVTMAFDIENGIIQLPRPRRGTSVGDGIYCLWLSYFVDGRYSPDLTKALAPSIQIGPP